MKKQAKVFMRMTAKELKREADTIELGELNDKGRKTEEGRMRALRESFLKEAKQRLKEIVHELNASTEPYGNVGCLPELGSDLWYLASVIQTEAQRDKRYKKMYTPRTSFHTHVDLMFVWIEELFETVEMFRKLNKAAL